MGMVFGGPIIFQDLFGKCRRRALVFNLQAYVILSCNVYVLKACWLHARSMNPQKRGEYALIISLLCK